MVRIEEIIDQPEPFENNDDCVAVKSPSKKRIKVQIMEFEEVTKPTIEQTTLSLEESKKYVQSILQQATQVIQREKKKTKWDARWNERLEELKTFQKINGHCNVIPSNTEWKTLGKWVYSQRHRRREGVLTTEQIHQLDEIDFQWNLRPRKEKLWQENYFEFQCQPEISKPAGIGTSWEERCKELEEFKRINGHCSVSRYKKPHEKLGRWLYDQKRKKQKGSLAEYRIKKLESIGIEW